jgi:hypothetical protein
LSSQAGFSWANLFAELCPVIGILYSATYYCCHDRGQGRKFQARGELDTRRRPGRAARADPARRRLSAIGAYAVGDDVRLVVADPFFAANQLDVTVRLLGFEVTPGDDAGAEQVTLTVAPIPEPEQS